MLLYKTERYKENTDPSPKLLSLGLYKILVTTALEYSQSDILKNIQY